MKAYLSDLISRQAAIDSLTEIIMNLKNVYGDMESAVNGARECIKSLPSAKPEILTIEEVSNQLGCATIQSALYWFEFLKTLDLLGFAIIRKETNESLF